MKIKLFALSFVVLAWFAGIHRTAAQGTAFTYQGRLNGGGTPANGTYDLVFTVFASASGINDAFANQTNSATSVSNGLFTVALNLGAPGIFTGEDRWLEIEVRTNGTGGYAKLSPRQKITATPYAITAGNVASNGLAGTYANAVTFSNPANSFGGAFFGNGAGLTNVTAAATNAWRLDGNNATTAGTHFLGTTDNQPLELQVNSTRALRIEPHGAAAPSLVGGYLQNTIGSYHGAVVAGGGTSGSRNAALGDYAFVGAGHGSMAADYSAVVAGAYNVTLGQLSFIGSGERNTNQANYSFIGGGSNNFLQASAIQSFIGGGTLNSNLADNAVIVGGARNLASGGGAFVGGGGNNTAADFNTVVAGGANNRAIANASTVGGGSENTASGDHSTLGGGQANVASGPASTIAGGVNNASSGDYATVGGGLQNMNSGYSATVGGGFVNNSSGIYATVSGGAINTSSGVYATVSGGGYNAATNDFATVPGGEYNLAGGQYSFAAGRQAQANHQGSFVWADSQAANFTSTANDEFSIRAMGGVRISPDTSMFFGSQTRQMLNFWSSAYGIGVQSYTHYFRTDAGASFAWFESGSHTNTFQDPGPGGNKLMTLSSSGGLNLGYGSLKLPTTTASGGVIYSGTNTLLHSYGTRNFFGGAQAGSFTTSGAESVGIGFSALHDDAYGYANVAVGNYTLSNNLTGIYNTAQGWGALSQNIRGSYNTANGSFALYSNTNGDANTASGDSALGLNRTGSRNTAVGVDALRLNTTGSNNIAIGFQAGFNLSSGSSNICIGNAGVAGESATMRIGSAQNSTYIAGIFGQATVGGIGVFVDPSGKLGTSISSRRFKENIEDMGEASDGLLALRPVTFRYKPKIDPKGVSQFGLIAEEVEKVNPDLVVRDDKNQIHTVRYEAVNAMLLNEFLKQHRKVQAQDKELHELRQCIETQKAESEELKSRLSVLEELVAKPHQKGN